MGNVGKLLKSAGIYFLGNVLTRMISFFLLPIYTAFIAKAEMGYFDVSTSYLNVLIPVICLDIWSGIMRFMFDHEEQAGKYKVIFNGMIIFSGSMVLYVLLFVGLGFLGNIQSIFFIFLYGILLMLQNLYTYLARGLGHNRAFALSGVVSSLVNSISNIVMILVFDMRLNSLYIAMILGLLVQLIILESKVKILGNMSLKLLDKGLIRSMVRFSVPLCLNEACFWFLSGYNKIGISHTLGLEANGLYTVAGKFTMMVAIVANCFSLAWQELVYSLGNEKENKSKLYTTASNYYLILLLFGALLIIPAIHIIFPFFVDAEYADAFSLIPLYMIATALSTFSSFLGNVFGAEKKTDMVFYSTVAAAAVNVATFHILVQYVGLHAANIGLAMGYLTIIIMRVATLKKSFDIRLEYRKIGLVILLTLPVFYVYLKGNLIANFVTILVILVIMAVLYRDLLKSITAIVLKKFKHRAG